MTRSTLRLILVVAGAIVGAAWADLTFGLVFPDNGARPGDPSHG
jgi:hypothetical protein